MHNVLGIASSRASEKDCVEDGSLLDSVHCLFTVLLSWIKDDYDKWGLLIHPSTLQLPKCFPIVPPSFCLNGRHLCLSKKSFMVIWVGFGEAAKVSVVFNPPPLTGHQILPLTQMLFPSYFEGTGIFNHSTPLHPFLPQTGYTQDHITYLS